MDINKKYVQIEKEGTLISALRAAEKEFKRANKESISAVKYCDVEVKINGCYIDVDNKFHNYFFRK